MYRMETTPPAPRSALRKIALWVWRLPAMGLVLGVRGYQIFLGPLLGKHCRFHPSCSNYFIQAVHKYGAVVGAWKGICRIGRCHPWNPGGYDPP
jgi:putative membrane protein insertion efficiency factor